MYYAQFADSAGHQPGDKVRIAGVDVGADQVAEDRRRPGAGRIHAGRQRDRHATAGCPSAPTPSWASESSRSSRAATRSLRPTRRPAAGSDHHAVPALRRLLRSDHQGHRRAGTSRRSSSSLNVLSETIDPDLSAAERRARRRGPLLRHHRQARRAVQGPAGQRQQGRRRAGQPQRADQPAAGQRPDTAGRDQRARPARSTTCWQNVSAVSQQFEGFINDNPNLNQRSRAAAHDQRRAGQAQGRPRRLDHHGVEVHGRAGRGDRLGPVLQDPAGEPAAVPDPAAVGGCRVQEARHRSRGVLAQRRSAGLPVPGSQRHQRQANGAPPPAPHVLEGTPEHPGPRRRARLTRARTRRPADGIPTPGNPLPCAGLDQGPYRRTGEFGPMRRRRDLAAEPGRRLANHGVPSCGRPRRARPPTCPVRRDRAAGARPAGGPHRAGRSDAGSGSRYSGYAPPPNALIGPIPPPGPGPQVPPVGDLAPIDQGGGA